MSLAFRIAGGPVAVIGYLYLQWTIFRMEPKEGLLLQIRHMFIHLLSHSTRSNINACHWNTLCIKLCSLQSIFNVLTIFVKWLNHLHSKGTALLFNKTFSKHPREQEVAMWSTPRTYATVKMPVGAGLGFAWNLLFCISDREALKLNALRKQKLKRIDL